MRLAFNAFLLTMILTMVGNHLALAGSSDYGFEVVEPQVQKSANAIVSVRLVNKVSGKPVSDAVILRAGLDMSPDNMADMTMKVTPSRRVSLESIASEPI